MSYQPLARKYRPSAFEDLVGQDAVAKALANGIRLGREPHAVIFSGVRGIGKTTAARLYAKALNCESGPTPEPCGTCSSCVAIANCTHEDVMEIDGASNTSVDDIRQLRETVDYVPQRSRFKVYIIDEVHMLSNSAFNALLKTLEEPPSHVVFMFATTELQKIPQTIVGRCQTFYLRKFSVEQIAGRLRFVLQSEGIKTEERVITEVAKRGNGSMRDALTFLDTAIAVSGGQLTFDRISDLLNTVSSDSLVELLEALLQKDGSKALAIIDHLDQQGVAFDELTEQIAELTRHGFILREFGDDAKLVARIGMDESILNGIQKLASQSKVLDLNRLFRTFVQCRGELDGSSLDRFVFENYCLEWCLDPGLPDLETLRSLVVNPGATASMQPPTKKPAPIAAVKETAPILSAAKVDAPVIAPMPAPTPEPKRDLRAAWLNTTSASPVEEAQRVVEAGPAPTVQAPIAQAPVVKEPVAAEPIKAVPPIGPGATPSFPSIQPEPPVPQDVELEQTFGPTMPGSWRELVDEWQKKKPLQARIFEETYSIHYDAQLISIGVNRDSLAGMKLLNRDVQTKVLQQMRELFGFNGQFNVVDRQDAESIASGQTDNQGESVLDTKRKEKEIRRHEIRNELQNSPSTKSILDVFGGRIESIEVIDPS